LTELQLGDVGERDKLILDHIPLLRHVVGRMSIPPSLLREDVEGYAMIGLIAAADSFDPSRGLKFSTYAFPKIRGAILDELRRMDFLPRGRRERLRELESVVSKLEQKHGVVPALEEIAAQMECSLGTVMSRLFYARKKLQALLKDVYENI